MGSQPGNEKINEGKEFILKLKIRNPDMTAVCYFALSAQSNGEALGASPIPTLGNVKMC